MSGFGNIYYRCSTAVFPDNKMTAGGRTTTKYAFSTVPLLHHGVLCALGWFILNSNIYGNNVTEVLTFNNNGKIVYRKFARPMTEEGAAIKLFYLSPYALTFILPCERRAAAFQYVKLLLLLLQFCIVGELFVKYSKYYQNGFSVLIVILIMSGSQNKKKISRNNRMENHRRVNNNYRGREFYAFACIFLPL